MLQVSIQKRELQFISPGKTSRGILYTKPSWFFVLSLGDHTGIGECSVIPGLNPEYTEGYEQKILDIAQKINQGDIPRLPELDSYPSIRFGLETALLNLSQKQQGVLYPSAFTRGEEGIAINGLIWMGNKQEMQLRISEKLNLGFKVLKLKVGALDFSDELALLKNIRTQFTPTDLEIRLDANGAFLPDEALKKLEKLSAYHIHSIEQPIQPGQWEKMAQLCRTSPIDIALDEELIGITSTPAKLKMLSTLLPRYIILKPSLLGGISISREWIELATTHNIGWWATSALESNIGLNAIAQWVYTLNPSLVQGLGTGTVFSNNINAPLELRGSQLFYNPSLSWDLP